MTDEKHRSNRPGRHIEYGVSPFPLPPLEAFTVSIRQRDGTMREEQVVPYTREEMEVMSSEVFEDGTYDWPTRPE